MKKDSREDTLDYKTGFKLQLLAFGPSAFQLGRLAGQSCRSTETFPDSETGTGRSRYSERDNHSMILMENGVS